MRQFLASPAEMFASFWPSRQFTLQMGKRDAFGRYRGSILGLARSFLNSLFRNLNTEKVFI
jgi:lipopolysaccharide transport system permease protein